MVLNSRATALTLIPALRRAWADCFCSSFRVEGRPKRFPDALASAIPACVRSISRSFSNSATAEITYIVIFPAGLVSSTPSERQAMAPDTRYSQLFHRFPDIHSISSKAIQFGDNQHVTIFHSVEQTGKSRPLNVTPTTLAVPGSSADSKWLMTTLLSSESRVNMMFCCSASNWCTAERIIRSR